MDIEGRTHIQVGNTRKISVFFNGLSYGQNQKIPSQGILDITIFDLVLLPDFLICTYYDGH